MAAALASMAPSPARLRAMVGSPYRRARNTSFSEYACTASPSTAAPSGAEESEAPPLPSGLHSASGTLYSAQLGGEEPTTPLRGAQACVNNYSPESNPTSGVKLRIVARHSLGLEEDAAIGKPRKRRRKCCASCRPCPLWCRACSSVCCLVCIALAGWASFVATVVLDIYRNGLTSLETLGVLNFELGSLCLHPRVPLSTTLQYAWAPRSTFKLDAISVRVLHGRREDGPLLLEGSVDEPFVLSPTPPTLTRIVARVALGEPAALGALGQRMLSTVPFNVTIVPRVAISTDALTGFPIRVGPLSYPIRLTCDSYDIATCKFDSGKPVFGSAADEGAGGAGGDLNISSGGNGTADSNGAELLHLHLLPSAQRSGRGVDASAALALTMPSMKKLSRVLLPPVHGDLSWAAASEAAAADQAGTAAVSFGLVGKTSLVNGSGSLDVVASLAAATAAHAQALRSLAHVTLQPEDAPRLAFWLRGLRIEGGGGGACSTLDAKLRGLPPLRIFELDPAGQGAASTTGQVGGRALRRLDPSPVPSLTPPSAPPPPAAPSFFSGYDLRLSRRMNMTIEGIVDVPPSPSSSSSSPAAAASDRAHLFAAVDLERTGSISLSGSLPPFAMRLEHRASTPHAHAGLAPRTFHARLSGTLEAAGPAAEGLDAATDGEARAVPADGPLASARLRSPAELTIAPRGLRIFGQVLRTLGEGGTGEERRESLLAARRLVDGMHAGVSLGPLVGDAEQDDEDGVVWLPAGWLVSAIAPVLSPPLPPPSTLAAANGTAASANASEGGLADDDASIEFGLDRLGIASSSGGLEWMDDELLTFDVAGGIHRIPLPATVGLITIGAINASLSSAAEHSLHMRPTELRDGDPLRIDAVLHASAIGVSRLVGLPDAQICGRMLPAAVDDALSPPADATIGLIAVGALDLAILLGEGGEGGEGAEAADCRRAAAADDQRGAVVLSLERLLVYVDAWLGEGDANATASDSLDDAAATAAAADADADADATPDAAAPGSFHVAISVEEDEVAETAAIACALSLPVATPIGLRVGALAFELHRHGRPGQGDGARAAAAGAAGAAGAVTVTVSGGAGAGGPSIAPLANLTVAPIRVNRGDEIAISLRLTLGLNSRATLTAAATDLLHGDHVMLCARGGLDSGPGDGDAAPLLHACANFSTARLAPWASERLRDDSSLAPPAPPSAPLTAAWNLLSNASVSVLGGSVAPDGAAAEVALPCIVPFVCPATSLASLRAFGESAVDFRLSLPSLAAGPADAPQPPLIPIDFNFSLHTPPLSLELGLAEFDTVATLHLPTFHMGPGKGLDDVLATFTVVDWYAVSKLELLLGGFPSITTYKLRGSTAPTASIASRILPELTLTLPPPPPPPAGAAATPSTPAAAAGGGGGIITLPSFFASPPSTPAFRLTHTTASSAEFSVPLELANPAPLALVLPSPTLELVADDGSTIVEVQPAGGHDLVLLEQSAKQPLPLALTLRGGTNVNGDGASCQVGPKPGCYHTADPISGLPIAPHLTIDECAPCKLGAVIGSLAEYRPTRLKLRLTLGGTDRAPVSLSAHIFTPEAAAAMYDAEAGIRAAALKARRQPPAPPPPAATAGPTAGDAVSAALSAHSPFDGILPMLGFDVSSTVFTSLQELVLNTYDDASAIGRLVLRIKNVFSVPLAIERLRASAHLRDFDGVLPKAVLMAFPLSADSYEPAPLYSLIEHAEIATPLPLLQPNATSPDIELSVPISWQSIVRFADETYMKDQGCLHLSDGLADASLTAGADPPFGLTLGFAYPEFKLFKQRACHQPLSCAPALGTSLRPGFDALNPIPALATTLEQVTFGGNAFGGASATGPWFQLVNGGLQRGAVFYPNPEEPAGGEGAAAAEDPARGTGRQRLMVAGGFEASFTFAIGDHCEPGLWWGCDDLTGGFAFVVQNSAPTALGDVCEASVHSTLPGATTSAAWGLVTADNSTTIACSGYKGIRKSAGVIFSTVHNRYWSVASPFKSASDWGRGALALYVDGDVSDASCEGIEPCAAGPRAVSQFGHATEIDQGSHTARVVFNAAAEMLYVYIDDVEAPALWGELSVSDLDLDDDGHAWVGFTGTSGPASAMSIWISDWSVGAPKTDASRSRLREDGEVIGRAFARGSVHLDARDSCGMPRTVGGDTWQVSVTWMGAEVGHDGIEDLGDGSYRVTVGPSWWGGEFRLTARLVEPSGPSTAVVEGSFIRNAGA